MTTASLLGSIPDLTTYSLAGLVVVADRSRPNSVLSSTANELKVNPQEWRRTRGPSRTWRAPRGC